uniref:Uncharacterized protein n=1 Tax=Eutreptiella gymnastica TaxID=73025 RepID=A0A7S4CZF7_9EUGL|eukprot:CAMPEP_0174385950 /NCGR_PEP_ID=MMETSP0811_2-20130205/126948_1 /TAXON_ID=73025 ORGANISM="Eutreptiella gymnastica-like, Strain CCMP1594" /NCGR_SAMPLE_ID=MMETSP0811_2 /ASSEMBLY_ACC=CAM_ASM_000667 /LENGTH=115 /DNA_ID=CAMNT_0015540453 /DNA_START=1338 /DNA_END=1685 /DNA_ORIENTATION=-
MHTQPAEQQSFVALQSLSSTTYDGSQTSPQICQKLLPMEAQNRESRPKRRRTTGLTSDGSRHGNVGTEVTEPQPTGGPNRTRWMAWSFEQRAPVSEAWYHWLLQLFLLTHTGLPP